MDQKITLTIGIPAYNAEKNIAQLLSSLCMQQTNHCVIEKIIVHVDAGNDNTARVARKIQDPRITIIEQTIRHGFAKSVNVIMHESKKELTVLLNDDIIIEDNTFIDSLIEPYLSENRVGLVSGNPQPLSPKNFVQRAIHSTFNAYSRIRYTMKNGDNHYTCDGKVLALSSALFNTITFPKNIANVGNLDAFLYFSCITNNFKYRHAKKAIVYFNFPATIRDYITWTTRNNSDYFILKKHFGQIVDVEYKIPRLLFIKATCIEFFKSPIGATPIVLIGIYAKIKARFAKANATWETIPTTKELN